MSKIPIFESPEDAAPVEEISVMRGERGLVSYRCKVLKSLLEINSESVMRTRPLVLRSAQRIVGATSPIRGR